MINSEKIESKLNSIYAMMNSLSASEKELLSDKLLSYLLFQPGKAQTYAKSKELKKTARKKPAPISKKDQELIKKIADKTDELYKRLGGDTI